MIFLYQIQSAFLMYFLLFFRYWNNKMPGGTYMNSWTKYIDGPNQVSHNSDLTTSSKIYEAMIAW